MPQSSVIGFFYALFAFLVWGLVPIFWKQLKDIPSGELLVHRVLWGLILLFIYLLIFKKLKATFAILKDRKKFIFLILTTILIQANWFIFIYAVTTGHIVESSLGYYINPLMNVGIGVLVFGERLRKLQWFAIALAIIGITILLFFGEAQALWISLSLAVTFAIYGYLKKKIHIPAAEALFFETGIAFVPAMIFFFLFTTQSSLTMTGDGSIWWRWTLLVGAGAITVIPLIAYNAALPRLQYATVGIMQYLTPTLQLLCGVVLYGEVFTFIHAKAFFFIWLALLIYTVDAIKFRMKNKRAK